MKKVSIYCDKNFTIGEIDKKLFGSFLEHLGRAVYTGVYEPGHPSSDEDGFRTDSLKTTKDLGITLVRYPGGNFVSGYNWKDGVGKNRPIRLNLAWQSLETNQFGLGEFAKWSKKANVEPLIAINVGTDTILSAAEEVEYCNHKGGTTISDQRIKDGSVEPFNFKYWCLGNEMDGDWQIGHMSADEYAKKAHEAAKIMRLANGERWDTKDEDKLKLVVCGSSVKELPTYPEWDRIVLEYNYDLVDYISMHRYYGFNKDGQNPVDDFLGTPTDLNEFIKTIEGIISYAKAKNRSKKDVYIALDEWNIWNGSDPRNDELWGENQHIIEQNYTFLDSLVFAGLMNTILNHSNSIKIACVAQLVNAIGLFITKENGDLIKQTIYYPFSLAANNAKGITLNTYNDSEEFDSWYGKSKRVNQAITYDDKNKEISMFICNFDKEEIDINSSLKSFGNVEVISSKTMCSNDLFVKNNFESPDNVTLTDLDVKVSDSSVQFIAKGYSYNFIKLKIK